MAQTTACDFSSEGGFVRLHEGGALPQPKPRVSVCGDRSGCVSLDLHARNLGRTRARRIPETQISERVSRWLGISNT
jgi:hypothetical protein